MNAFTLKENERFKHFIKLKHPQIGGGLVFYYLMKY